ncbi:MAG: [FeFe] hydrogenase H-cluster maturation GTPase HydF [Defluviitaleaceae bacterium]|nr:[FeFe] hydrogenase H-cluster maturation GTPase HydF [Defluviitaleaceae bacterium]
MNKTPTSHRLHIGIFGRQSAGKSSLLNAITGQDTAVVSEIKGTTTDPVFKPMEILPIGPCVLIDTPGIDDTSELGEKRIQRTNKILRRTDLALLVVDSAEGISDYDTELIAIFNEKNIKHIVVYTKTDLHRGLHAVANNEIHVSSITGENIHELKEKIAEIGKMDEEPKLVADLLDEGDVVVLVVPIDSSAPKGRLILPQQQTVRDIIDAGAVSIICQPEQLAQTLQNLANPPKLVIADSQVFGMVSGIVPKEIPLTAFSILMARLKGVLKEAIEGAYHIDNIKNGNKILIAEGCTHHRQCDDIGTVKIPTWIEKHTSQKPIYEFTSGGDFPDNLDDYRLIIHCGACMQNTREMQYRKNKAADYDVPMTNYGIAISHMHGILPRIILPFVDVL